MTYQNGIMKVGFLYQKILFIPVYPKITIHDCYYYYENNVDVGTGKLVITGSPDGNVTGTIEKVFRIIEGAQSESLIIL